jgi:hypothetical protein
MPFHALLDVVIDGLEDWMRRIMPIASGHRRIGQSPNAEP